MNNEDRKHIEQLEQRMIDLTIAVDSLARGLRGDPENDSQGVVHQVKSVRESLNNIDRDITSIKIELTEVQNATKELKEFKSSIIKASTSASGIVAATLLGIWEFVKSKML